jgi:hypothetical protein
MLQLFSGKVNLAAPEMKKAGEVTVHTAKIDPTDIGLKTAQASALDSASRSDTQAGHQRDS